MRFSEFVDMTWALLLAEHSDPKKLQETAATLKDPEALAARQKEMKDLLEALRQVDYTSATH